MAIDIKIRRAKVGDVQQIVSMINSYAEKGEMLYRSQSQVLQQVRNYFVAVTPNSDSSPNSSGDSVLACGSLDITWNDLAELRSLAVREDAQSRGLGTQVVEALMNDAAELGLKHVFALTYKPHFFERLGFKIIDKQQLPHKVWSICIDCLKFPVCDEVAMQIDVEEWAERKI
ncbi:MAG: N-acetyltransferase [Bacteroidetes bacterium]|nr:N-acetyltransferase [Bacteroidota bacterium]MCL5737070.1 N-acetyltransferase [Bacteroidota bacterium]